MKKNREKMGGYVIRNIEKLEGNNDGYIIRNMDKTAQMVRKCKVGNVLQWEHHICT